MCRGLIGANGAGGAPELPSRPPHGGPEKRTAPPAQKRLYRTLAPFSRSRRTFGEREEGRKQSGVRAVCGQRHEWIMAASPAGVHGESMLCCLSAHACDTGRCRRPPARDRAAFRATGPSLKKARRSGGLARAACFRGSLSVAHPKQLSVLMPNAHFSKAVPGKNGVGFRHPTRLIPNFCAA